MFIQNITMDEFAQKKQEIKTVILPVGVLEEHGSHLPLGLDAMHAVALAELTAKIHPCFVAPPLNYGLCRSTHQHPGTVGISFETLKMHIHDISHSFYKQGITSICILTGHAGSTHGACLVDAGEALIQETNLKMAVVCVLDLLEDAKDFLECPKDSHAGEVETSIAMHLWPELVKGTSPEEYPTFPRFLLVKDKLKYWPNGVWGDPSKASPEKGKRILESEAQALAKVLNDLENQK